jgi:hypothetical protein
MEAGREKDKAFMSLVTATTSREWQNRNFGDALFHALFMAPLQSKYAQPFGSDTTRWRILTEGALTKGQSCWTRDGDHIFYRCSSCLKIRRLLSMDVLILSPHLINISCEKCPDCGAHHWYIFWEWAPRKVRGAIKVLPNACPVCRTRTIVTYNGGYRECTLCQIVWKARNFEEGPMKKEKARR